MTDRTFQTTGGLGLQEDRQVLEECRTDPIQRTASLQPHGTFLELDPDDLEVLSAATNLEDYLEVPPGRAIGGRLTDLLAADALPPPERWPGGAGPLKTRFGLEDPSGRLLATLFPARDTLGLELERPAGDDPGSDPLLLDVQPRLSGLRATDSERDLYRKTVRLVRLLTGFDRVMLYRFGEEGHGEVVAEDAVPEADSYLGQRFPASDIPEPARRLYRKNVVRHIPRVDYAPVPILGPEGERERWDLDLTYSHLRGVPAVHRQYLENMGVRSSFSVSLLEDGELWGLIACHGVEPQRLDRATQSVCGLIGHTVSQQLARLHAEATHRRRQDVAEWRTQFEPPSTWEELFQQLEWERDRVLGFLDASAFLIRVGSESLWLAEDGPEEAPADLLRYVSDRLRTQERVSVRSIVGEVDASWDRSERFSGLLARRLGSSPGHFCCWLRPEVRQTIRWGGNPREPVQVGPDGGLSPRNSFEEWTQHVAGRSRPWTDLDLFTAREVTRFFNELVVGLQADRLRAVNRELEGQNASLRDAKEELENLGAKRQELLEQMKELARTDDLTGLANRRGLMRRLESEIERARRYDKGLSLVLLDLDRFKRVNDRYGHQAGDRVLRRLGELLEDETRVPDSAGRYGGEEFLLVLPESDADKAAEVADRLLEEIRGWTFRHDDHEFGLTCSAGVTELEDDDEEMDELIQRADAALYRAKKEGRDRRVVL